MGNNIGTIYHPWEEFAQTLAGCFLMPASKVRAIIEKEFGSLFSDRYKLLQLEAARKRRRKPAREP